MVVKNLSCNLNLGAQFNYQTGFVPQKVIQSQDGRKINCSKLDGTRIILQFQDVSNKTLRRALHLAHVVQENSRQRPVKRKLTPPEIPDHADQEVEKMID